MNSRIGLSQWALVVAVGAAAYILASQTSFPDEAAEGETSLVSEVSARPLATAAEPAATPAPAEAPALPRREAIATDGGEDAFGPVQWIRPPAPPPVINLPPPAPTAPPLPFRFVGVIEDKSGPPAAFLAKGEALHIVRVGDVVENTYRVESFSPSRIVLTYLPLGQEQSLSPAGGNP
jgi:hypothetical protein